MNIQPNMQFWRENPFNSQEVMYRADEFPQRFGNLREQIERATRDQLQRGCTINVPRILLFNQMSAQNYANSDWIQLISSIGQLLEVDAVAYNVPVNADTVAAIIGRVINVFLVRLYERDPNVRAYMTQQELIAMQNLQVERNQVIQAVEAFYSRAAQPQYAQPQYAQPQYAQPPAHQQLSGGAWGTSIYGGGVQQQPAEISVRRTVSLETNTAVPNAMQNAYEQAVSQVVEKQYARPESFVASRFPGRSIYDTVTVTPTKPAGPVLEELHIHSSTNATYQAGGEEVSFDQFFTSSQQPAYDPREEDQQMAAPTGVAVDNGVRYPMIDICGIARPIVYKKYQQKITENGEIVMEYKDHELNQSALAPEPQLRSIPIYPNVETEAPAEDFVPEIAHLDDAKVKHLAEPLFNMEPDTAFQYVDFTNAANSNQSVVHFVNIKTDSVQLADRSDFLERFKALAVDSDEGDFTKIVHLIRETELYSYALFRKLDRRATEATNEVLKKQLGLVVKIESFVEDFLDLPGYLSNSEKYGPAWVGRFEESLGTIHSAICCLLSETTGQAMLATTAAAIQLTTPSGLRWNPANHTYYVPNAEELVQIEEAKAAVEEEFANLDGLVQLFSSDYCVLVPVEFAKLGMELKPGEVSIVAPSVTPELADFINEAVNGAGLGHSFRRILLGTPDGVVMQLHQTPGRDVDGRVLWGVEQLLA